jgi:hypothetical protein
MPCLLYILQPGEVKFGTWYEVLIHVYWTTDTDGVLEAWIREKGQSSFVKKLDLGPVGSSHVTQFNFPTLQLGTMCCGATGTITLDNIDGYSQYISDVVGVYTSYAPLTAYRDNWCKATTYEAARACLP